MKKDITIFSNYYDSEREKYTREFLFEDSERANDEGWESPDDIPDSVVWEEMNFEDEINWQDTSAELDNFFEGKTLLITGDCGLWYGTREAGTVGTVKDLRKCWEDCGYIHIFDLNGHFHITCSHHDGTNHFEVKILTERGINRYNNWNSNWNDKTTEQEVHGILYNNSCYSVIPHFAKKVYGCKTR